MEQSNIEILENQIIGSLIVNKDTHIHIKNLSEDMFTYPKSKYFFKAIKTLYLQNKEIDTITLNNSLSSGIEKDSNKNLREICNIIDSVYTTANIVSNIEKLVDINMRIKMKNIITETMKELTSLELNVYEIKDLLKNKLSEIKDTRETKCINNIQDILSNTFEEMENKKNKGEDYSLYTGFLELDKITDGLHESELTSVGARPGVGKTAFGLNIATNIAMRGKKVYFINLEMNENQIMQRILARYSNTNSQFIRTGRIDESELLKIANSVETILKMQLSIDTRTRYIEDIEYIAHNLKDKNEIEVLVIDYLTLIKSKNKYQIRELEVAEISRKLKLLALDLQIPILLLVQLNRDAENRIPTMATIRESGSIEQNCDNIIFLHSENKEEARDVEIMKIIVEKQRQGTTGSLQLKFAKKYSQFRNIV